MCEASERELKKKLEQKTVSVRTFENISIRLTYSFVRPFVIACSLDDMQPNWGMNAPARGGCPGNGNTISLVFGLGKQLQTNSKILFPLPSNI